MQVQQPTYTLAINTAEQGIQLVLAHNTPPSIPASLLTASPEQCGLTPVVAQQWSVTGQGAELLIPAVQNICELLHIAPVQIQRIAVVQGPGSFTGLRLALGTAAALHRATNAVQGGIHFLWLLALHAARQLNATARPAATRLLAVTHARRGLVHMQAYDWQPPQEQKEQQIEAETLAIANMAGALVPVEDVHVCSLEEAGAYMQDRDIDVAFGSGITRNNLFFAKLLSSACRKPELLPVAFTQPDAATLAVAAACIDYTTHDIAPLYVRPCDAEENLPHIAAKLHIDADAAQQALQRMQTTQSLQSHLPSHPKA